jgi:type IV secretion system protein VirD4
MSKSPEEFLHEMMNTNHAECLRKKGFPEEQIKIMTDYWGSDINKNIYAVAESLYNMSSKKSQNIPGAQFKPFEAQQSKGADGQLHGVLGTAKSFLALYQDPIVAYNISESDFKIDDLYNNDSAVDLYAVVPPSRTQQDRLRPLVRLLISLTLDKIQQYEAKKKHRLLFMIDEFPTLKKMDDIEDAFSTAAGYGLKFFLIMQDIKQLEKYYGEKQGIYSNAHVRLIYSTADEKTKKMVSEQSGTYTYIGPVKSQTRSGGVFGTVSTTTAMQESRKPLVLPDQVEKLPDNRMFIFIKGMNAIKCWKANYRKDKKLLALTQNDLLESDRLIVNNEPTSNKDESAPKRPNLCQLKQLEKFSAYVTRVQQLVISAKD